MEVISIQLPIRIRVDIEISNIVTAASRAITPYTRMHETGL